MVVAAVLVLATIVSVMHYQQSVSRRSIMRSTADLNLREALRWAEADKVGWKLKSGPTDCRMQVGVSPKSPTGWISLADPAAKKIWSDLDDISIKPDSKLPAPGTTDIEFTPKSSDASLLVYGKHVYSMEHSKGLGYALYAPKGTIKAGQVTGWANPRFDDPREVALEAYDGVPTLVAANGVVNVTKMDYGSLYSKTEVPKVTEGLAVGYKGYFPLREYETDLDAQLSSTVFSKLDGVARQTDKTELITGGIFDFAKSVALMITGSGGGLNLSLQQAVQFPFPPIPGFCQTVPGLIYEIWISVPQPPDFAQDSTAGEKDGENFANEAKKRAKAVDDAKAELATAKANRSAYTGNDADKIKELDKAVTDAQKKVDDAEQKLKDLESEGKADADKKKKAIKDSAISPNLPITRTDDAKITNKNGQIGWCYLGLIDKFVDFVGTIISGGSFVDALADMFFQKVRLVGFGRKDNVPEFSWSSGFESEATWNVPTGRSFCYRGDMTINGDLWLQRGSTCLIEGNLSVKSPGGVFGNPIKPSGRIFLEEGSTLLVTGNLECEGTKLYGSIMLGSQAGMNNPISSAILCKGNVKIPYGMRSAMTLVATTKWLGTKEAAIGKINTVLEPLLNLVAPNAAKVVGAGPFHFRPCYFASYATTFQIVIIPIISIPVPLPIPLPHKNQLVPIFKVLTKVYGITLNLTLGENLYTYTDWWVFGQGVVPMVPKLDPTAATKIFDGWTMPTFPTLSTSDLKKVVETYGESALKELAVQAVTKIITELAVKLIAAAAIPGGAIAMDLLIQPMIDKLEDELNDALKTGSFMDTVKGDIMDAIKDKLQPQIDTLLSKASELLIRESAGAVIYSGGTVEIGSSTDPTAALIASGLIVAKSHVSIHARQTVGQVVSVEGNIDLGTNQLLYNPYFSRASLYIPKSSQSDWILRAFELGYGKDYANTSSDSTVQVEPQITDVITCRGWR